MDEKMVPQAAPETSEDQPSAISPTETETQEGGEVSPEKETTSTDTQPEDESGS